MIEQFREENTPEARALIAYYDFSLEHCVRAVENKDVHAGIYWTSVKYTLQRLAYHIVEERNVLTIE